MTFTIQLDNINEVQDIVNISKFKLALSAIIDAINKAEENDEESEFLDNVKDIFEEHDINYDMLWSE